MKRIKDSGAAFRKKKKAREEEVRKNEGALLKFFSPVSNGKETISSPIEAIPESQLSINSSDSSSSSNREFNDQNVVSEFQPLLNSSDSLISSDEECSEQSTQKLSDTNLKDVGLWPRNINKDIRILLVRQGASVVQHLDSNFGEVVRPSTSMSTKGRNRKLTREWFFRALPNNEKILRSWLVYSPSKKALYCFCCRLFSDISHSNLDSVDGFNKWWKLNPKISQHESSAAHVLNFSYWKELEIRIKCNATIDKKEQEIVEKEVKKWREILSRLLDIIRFLAKPNLALRGHREGIYYETDESESSRNRGNFLELVHLLAKYDPVLREHILRIKLEQKYTVSYMSPTIQNEFIEILGENVRTKIIEQVKQAKYFSMIFDSTPDISHKDQTSQVLRYVKIDGKKVKVVESFVDFIETKGKTAENISTMILEKFKIDGIDIQNCRGQAYDNAAVMAGQHTGVQTRIKEINRKAEFVACTNHGLNLAGVHAASVAVNSVTFFGVMERLFVFFSSSTHRWDILTSVTGRSVKRIIETRWSARGEAVSVVKKNYSKILTSLEQLTGEEENAVTRSDAGVLLGALQSFSFLCFLGLWESVLLEINDTQIYFQTKGLNIQQCDIKLDALKEYLFKNREYLVNTALTYAKGICDDLGIVMDRQRRRIKKKTMFGELSNDAELSYESELRREMFSSLDRTIGEITLRFQQLHFLAEKYAFLTSSNQSISILNGEYECQLPEDLDDINKEEFFIERKRLQNSIAAATRQDDRETWKGSPLEVLQFIQKYDLADSVPNIVISLRIFLTIAVSVATCERSFPN